MSEFTPQDLFDKWLAYLRDQGSDKYVNSERMNNRDVLVEMLFNMKFDHDIARSFKNKVLMALTHEEGRKGKGKYSGWKECVESDFDACVANWYVKVSESTGEDNRISKKEQAIDLDDLMTDDPDIRKWLIEKYGDKCTEALIKEAHTIGNILNIRYLTDTFDQRKISYMLC